MSYRPIQSQAYSVGQGARPARSPGVQDPAGCVRGAPAYASEYDCDMGKPGDKLCVPEYRNGAWDRFTPYSRDSQACMGPRPPQLAPQALDDAALIEASGWYNLANLSLKLMMGGHIASFSFTIDGRPQTVHFDQANLVESLDMPLMYVYSQPHDEGIMRLELNLTNGHANISFPLGNGFAVVRYLMMSA